MYRISLVSRVPQIARYRNLQHPVIETPGWHAKGYIGRTLVDETSSDDKYRGLVQGEIGTQEEWERTDSSDRRKPLET